MTQLLLRAHVSKLTTSANVQTTKEEIKELKKERSEVLEACRNMPETIMKTIMNTMSGIERKLAAKEDELTELSTSQEATESEIMELHKGFVFQVKSGPKLKYCLVHAKPAILEIEVQDAEMKKCPAFIKMGKSTEEEMCMDIFPKALVPNEEGHYRKLRKGTYIFVYDNPMKASDIKGSYFNDSILVNSIPELNLQPLPFGKQFVPPKVLSRANHFLHAYESCRRDTQDGKTATEAIDLHVTRMFLSVVEEAKQNTTDETDIIEHTFSKVVGPFVEVHEVTANGILLPWVKMNCLESDAVIVTGNEFLDSLNVTYHSNSKPDFVIYNKNNSCAIMVECPSVEGTEKMEIDDEESHAVLYGIAGECKIANQRKTGIESKAKAQLQANLFAVAGVLAQNALQNDTDFDEICVYGVCCFHEDEAGYLIILHLNFRDQASHFFMDNKPHKIDELIAYALKKCNLRNF